MSRQIGSLNRFCSYPSKHQLHNSLIKNSEMTSSSLYSFSSNSPRIDSDDSNQTIFNSFYFY